MIVKCIANTGKYLKSINKLHEGVSEQTLFGMLEIGREYFVVGFVQDKEGLLYLLNTGSFHSLAPIELFEIVESRIGCEMYFTVLKESNPMYPFRLSVLSYKEFGDDESHFYNLMDCEKQAREVFAKRSFEMEEQSKSNIYYSKY